MTAYLDASIIVALFSPDIHSGAAERMFRSRGEPILVSDFAASEFASAVARKVRSRELPARQAQVAFANFDLWINGGIRKTELKAADVALATSYVRRLGLPLRTPDAINIALAQRHRATLVTFDRAMAGNARKLGLDVRTS